MLVLQNAYKNIFSLFLFACAPLCIYGESHDHVVSSYANTRTEVVEHAMPNQNILKKTDFARSKKNKNQKELSYYLYVEDFIESFIDIPTSNVSSDSSTISSKYLAGRAAVYNTFDKKVGTCSASFLCMKNKDGIYTDISNYLSVDNGLVVSWFTPTTLINLELDSILHSMVTECIVFASTKVGFNPFYGKHFNMVVSSDDKKIYFKLKEI